MASKKAAEQAQEAEVESAAATPTDERQPGDEPAKKPFDPVRGWHSQFTGPLKFRRLTDANLKAIVFKFNLGPREKLPEEALAVMREHKQDKGGNPTGLEFKDTRAHGKVWLIPNDAEGRALADKIDFKLSQIAEKMEQGQGQTPF
jgi:hypothetical protein